MMTKLHDKAWRRCDAAGRRESRRMILATRTDELVHLVVEDIWNRGDLEKADPLFTPDYVNHGGLIPDVVCGPEAIKFSAMLYRRAFPNFYINVEEIVEDKADIVLRWVAYHNGPPLGEIPSRRKGCLRGITRARLEGGRVAESWTAWDKRAALARWGARKQVLSGQVDDEDREALAGNTTGG